MTQHVNPIDSAAYQRAIAQAHVLRAQAVNEFFAGLAKRVARAWHVERRPVGAHRQRLAP